MNNNTIDWVNELLRACQHGRHETLADLIDNNSARTDVMWGPACVQAAGMSANEQVLAKILPFVDINHMHSVMKTAMQGGSFFQENRRRGMVAVALQWMKDQKCLNLSIEYMEQAVALGDATLLMQMCQHRTPNTEEKNKLAFLALRRGDIEMIDVVLQPEDHDDFERTIIKAMMAPFWKNIFEEPFRLYKAVQQNKWIQQHIDTPQHVGRRSKM